MNAGTHIIGGALVGALIAPEPLVILAGAIHAGIHSQLAPLGKLIQKLLLEDL